MRTLNRTLRESDDAILPTLARVWNVDIEGLMDSGEIIDLLSRAMLDPERVERVWTGLNDPQRGALLTLISSKSKMPMPAFERLFGQIRRMGAAQIDRERPDENPQGPAEALFYRGLIAQGWESADTGARSVVYIPDDLRAVLPAHKTAYENLEDDGVESDEPHEDIKVEPVGEVSGARNADTTVVDDLTTLLAYLQLTAPPLEHDPIMETLADYTPSDADRDALTPFLLTPDSDRLTFLLGLALGAELIDVQNGRAYPRRADTRRWLEASRTEQVRRLAEAWRENAAYRELWHVPGLHPEPGGSLNSYNPAAVRQVVAGFLTDLAPSQEWWSVSEFIDAVKETDPDFQRPGGDYDSWYIRNDSSEYLEGFASWDAIEGALLEFLLAGPLHWLGMVDVADDAARLTAYGRAFLGLTPWPAQPETVDKLVVRDDGTLTVSRRVPRIDRFQIARFTTWIPGGDPYTYRLDARGISQGARQGITTAHIAGYISKALNEPTLTPAIASLLETWREGPVASASIERLLVLRTTSPDVMNRIWDTPTFRRYLGARLGEMAVVVRAEQAPALRDALGAAGIQVEFSE